MTRRMRYNSIMCSATTNTFFLSVEPVSSAIAPRKNRPKRAETLLSPSLEKVPRQTRMTACTAFWR